MTQWNKIFFFAILPALIAGLFSIAPKIFDIATSPKAELTYSKIDGPNLSVNGKIRKIQSLTIANTGKKTLNNIIAQYEVENGIIEQYEIKDNFAIKPTVTNTNNLLSIELENLHPKESFSMSAMTLLDQNNSKLQFNLRSKEVIGIKKSNDAKKKNNKKDLAGALLSSLSVFLMAIMVLRGKLPFFMTKQDALYYIVAKLKISVVSDNIELFKPTLTFLRLSDILLSIGLSHKDKKYDCIKALKCMLFIKSIAKQSLALIIENIKTLEAENFSQEEIEQIRKKATNITNLVSYRNTINKFLDENGD